MKKQISIFLFLFLAIATTTLGQKDPFDNGIGRLVLKTDLSSYLRGDANLGIEYLASRNLSLDFGGGYLLGYDLLADNNITIETPLHDKQESSPLRGVLDYKNGYSFNSGFRVYLDGRLMPFGSYISYNYRQRNYLYDDDRKTIHRDIVFVYGFSNKVSDHFVFDISIGFGERFSRWKNWPSSLDPLGLGKTKDNFHLLVAKIKLGYVF